MYDLYDEQQYETLVERRRQGGEFVVDDGKQFIFSTLYIILKFITYQRDMAILMTVKSI